MNLMHRLISKQTAMILFNLCMGIFLFASGEVTLKPDSIVAVIVVVVIMNFVAWRSGKEFLDWK